VVAVAAAARAAGPPLDGTDPEVRAALVTARDAARAAPGSAAARGEYGLLLRAHGFHAAADDCFRTAAALDPADSRWPYLLGSRLALSDPAAALPWLRQALDPGHPDAGYRSAARLRLAEVLLELDRTDEAEPLLAAAAAAEPRHPRVRYDLAALALRRGDGAGARRWLVEVTENPHARRKAAALLAALEQRAGNPTAAADWARHAAAGPPDLPWPDPYVTEYLRREVGRKARIREAESLEARGRHGEAVRLLEEVAADGSDPVAIAALGIVLAKAGDYDRAEAVLREAARLDPSRVQPVYFLALVLEARAQRLALPVAARAAWAEAADAARRAVALKPDHGTARLTLGRALRKLGRTAEAIGELTEAVRCRPELAETHKALAEALAEVGRADEARRELAQAKELAATR
jgi:tetratricopeptide (TPR) repeat protein